MKPKKRILVAPLNWGLGHATRCIPIISALIDNNFEPIIGSDGSALKLLQLEFPHLKSIALPSYNITYSKYNHLLKFKLFLNYSKFSKTIIDEKQKTKKLVTDLNLSGIISDNRFGVISHEIPSVYITHQLKVLSGLTTKFSTKWHQNIISKYDECWIPDKKDTPNLSGSLSHFVDLKTPLKYIGPISRLEKKTFDSVYNVMVLLSGPEPQRQILEDKLLKLFKAYKGSVLFVKGIVKNETIITKTGSLTVCNYLKRDALEDAINKSEIVISRSGYTTIMDLAKLEKKAYFIPTPGQYEQLYLAKLLTEQKLVPSCRQEEFTIEKLDEITNFKGLSNLGNQLNYKQLFNVFRE